MKGKMEGCKKQKIRQMLKGGDEIKWRERGGMKEGKQADKYKIKEGEKKESGGL